MGCGIAGKVDLFACCVPQPGRGGTCEAAEPSPGPSEDFDAICVDRPTFEFVQRSVPASQTVHDEESRGICPGSRMPTEDHRRRSRSSRRDRCGSPTPGTVRRLSWKSIGPSSSIIRLNLVTRLRGPVDRDHGATCDRQRGSHRTRHADRIAPMRAKGRRTGDGKCSIGLATTRERQRGPGRSG